MTPSGVHSATEANELTLKNNLTIAYILMKKKRKSTIPRSGIPERLCIYIFLTLNEKVQKKRNEKYSSITLKSQTNFTNSYIFHV